MTVRGKNLIMLTFGSEGSDAARWLRGEGARTALYHFFLCNAHRHNASFHIEGTCLSPSAVTKHRYVLLPKSSGLATVNVCC